MTKFLRSRAALERATGIAAPADRPRQRRNAEQPDAPARVAVRVQGLELRSPSTSDALVFRGYASVTEAGYEMWDAFGPYTEKVALGAFDATLTRGDLDVPLVLQHEDLRRIARTTNGTLRLSEDDTGLLVEAELDPDDHDVKYIAPKLRSGLIDEMSFRFRIDQGSWSPDWSEYRIERADIHRGDVAIVGYGASPHTAGAGLADATDPVALTQKLDEHTARSIYTVLQKRFTTPIPRITITDEDIKIRSL